MGPDRRRGSRSSRCFRSKTQTSPCSRAKLPKTMCRSRTSGQAREVTLTEADKLTPVKVAIWDSGSDLSLFPGRDLHRSESRPGRRSARYGLRPEGLSHARLSAAARRRAAEAISGHARRAEGLLRSAALHRQPRGHGAEAEAGQHVGGAGSRPSSSSSSSSSIYSHGTHVAGIASRGNPAIRLAVGRITFDWHNIPLAPSEELSRRAAADYGATWIGSARTTSAW